MDTLKFLIPYFLKIAFAFFFAAFVWWVVALLIPSLSFANIAANFQGKLSSSASSTREDWLPSPRKYQGLFGRRAETPNENTNLFKAGDPFNGYNLNDSQYTYSTYRYSTGSSSIDGGDYTVGNTTTKDPLPESGIVSGISSSKSSPTNTTNARLLTVRNLSIYEGGHVYTGLSFIGEAKSSMFREGRFPIVVVDKDGRVVGISTAVATTNWTIPGWTKFETKINYALPSNMPCTMIFEEALTQNERGKQPLRVPFGIRCN